MGWQLISAVLRGIPRFVLTVTFDHKGLACLELVEPEAH